MSSGRDDSDFGLSKLIEDVMKFGEGSEEVKPTMSLDSSAPPFSAEDDLPLSARVVCPGHVEPV